MWHNLVGPGAFIGPIFLRTLWYTAAAAIISLLYTVDGLSAVLSLNDRGWQWVLSRAGDIASGSWVGDCEPELPEVNLAVTIAAVRQALQ